MLSKIEQQHYHRQLILTEIGEIGQSKLKKAAVLVYWSRWTWIRHTTVPNSSRCGSNWNHGP